MLLIGSQRQVTTQFWGVAGISAADGDPTLIVDSSAGAEQSSMDAAEIAG